MEASAKPKPLSRNFNRTAYAIFLLAGMSFLARKDFSSAFTFWAIAPIFDPFNPNTPFKTRPTYQKAWLIVHAMISLVLLTVMIFK